MLIRKQALNQCACGILRKIPGLNALRFFEIHKVFLQNRAFLSREIFLQSALGN